jgi:hypothetical protein
MVIIEFLKKLLGVFIGVFFIPLTITVSKAFYHQLSRIALLENQNQTWFLLGVVSYVIVHLFLFKMNYVYNLGHEVVHVISTWLSFGRAKNMKVSDKGGSVQTTKSNFFINISPYFVPIYTVILCISYFIWSRFGDVSSAAPYFIFFIGFSLAMHIIMTVDALKVSQPDLIKTGYLSSISIIYVINIIVAAFVISLIFTGFSFIEFFLIFCVETKKIYIFIFQQLFAV